MTWLDRYLQKRRIREARRELPPGARVLDIGTYDGTLFALTRARGVGIDPELAAVTSIPGVTLVKGSFPKDLPKLPNESFDAVTALAVIEHVPESELVTWAETIARLVVPSGLLIITVPAPAVDTILHVLMRLNVVAGMAAHQHHRFELSNLDHIFTVPLWQRAKHRTFQLGLNHLYVFERSAHLQARTPGYTVTLRLAVKATEYVPRPAAGRCACTQLNPPPRQATAPGHDAGAMRPLGSDTRRPRVRRRRCWLVSLL